MTWSIVISDVTESSMTTVEHVLKLPGRTKVTGQVTYVKNRPGHAIDQVDMPSPLLYHDNPTPSLSSIETF